MWNMRILRHGNKDEMEKNNRAFIVTVIVTKKEKLNDNTNFVILQNDIHSKKT